MGQLGHLLNGHDRTGLIVDHHNGYKNGVLTESFLQRCQRNIAQAIRLEIGDLKSLGLQICHAVQNRMMLDGCGDDMFAPFAQPFDSAENGPVVGFGTAGGEEHPVSFRTHDLG